MDEASTATGGRTSERQTEPQAQRQTEPNIGQRPDQRSASASAESAPEPETSQRHNPFTRLHERLHRNPVTGLITKVVVTIVGVGVICAGIVMLVAPGPGIVGIIVGLAILALEYDWAERWMHAARKRYHDSVEQAKQMDPVVRRRRIALTLLAVVIVAGAIIGYLVTYDWPGWALTGWDAVQSIGTFLPELPGM